MDFPSHKSFDEKSNFPILPADDYEVVITEVREDMQDKYMAKPNPKTGEKEQEEVIKVMMEIVSFKDGAEAKDEKGESTRGRKIFFTGRPKSVGWTREGLPAKTRCLIYYALGLDMDAEGKDIDPQDIVGKTVYIEIVEGKSQRGQKVNKIARFITPPRERDTENVVEKEDIPVINEEEVNANADEVSQEE